MSVRNVLSWTALLGASLGIHAVGFAKLGNMAGPLQSKPAPTPSFMEMAAAPRPAAAPPPVEAPEKPAPKAVRRMAAAAPRLAPTTTPRPAAAAPVAAETPADFSGTTLTNDGPGPGWASATGNGQAISGPIGRPGARVTGRHVEARSAAARPVPAAVVAVADLSRLPQAPKLDEALERNYPVEARRMGQAGKSVVRARITPDGTVRDLLVISESASGFGRACQEVLVGSRWTPPLDRDGRAVATIINYTCRFEVR